MRQQVLPLGHSPALRREDFLVSSCNAAALAQLDLWPVWPLPSLVITGPGGCGKTHLLNIWAEKAGARLLGVADITPALLARLMAAPCALAVDDLDSAYGVPETEQALFHLYNRWREAGASLLLASRQTPSAATIGLPDLASRLRALPAVAVELPDDLLLARILAKLFADRQVIVAAEVVTYLLTRMERSFHTAGELVRKLDQAALAGKRPVTISLARQVMQEGG